MSKRLLLVAVAALVALAVAVPASANMQPPIDLIPDGDQPTSIESVELMVWASLTVDTEWARPSSSMSWLEYGRRCPGMWLTSSLPAPERRVVGALGAILRPEWRYNAQQQVGMLRFAYVAYICSTCGCVGHAHQPESFPDADIDDRGRGALICGICGEPLADHLSVTMHDIPELSLRMLRSSGVPWSHQPGQAFG
jgi:hypothetical protein